MSIQILRGTTLDWNNKSDIIISEGQLAAERLEDSLHSTNTTMLKVGDGTSTYSSLPYVGQYVFAKLDDETQTIGANILNSNKINCDEIYASGHISSASTRVQNIYSTNTGKASITLYYNNLELAGDSISIINTERAESYDLVNLIPEERYIAYYHPWSNVSSSNNLTVTCRRWGNVVHTQFEGLIYTGNKVAQSISEITIPEKYRPVLVTRSCEFGLSSNNVVSYNTWWIESDGRVFLVSTSGSAYEVHVSFTYLC